MDLKSVHDLLVCEQRTLMTYAKTLTEGTTHKLSSTIGLTPMEMRESQVESKSVKL